MVVYTVEEVEQQVFYTTVVHNQPPVDSCSVQEAGEVRSLYSTVAVVMADALRLYRTVVYPVE